MLHLQSSCSQNKRHDATAEIENYKRQLDFMAGERSCFEEAVHKKEYQIRKLTEDLEELQTYKESVPILQQQVG